MKTNRIHAPSAALGALVLGLAGLLIGAQVVGPAPVAVPRPTLNAGVLIAGGPVTVRGIPTPQQMLRIEENTNYTVPAGKIFVATGIARINGDQDFGYISFDGQVVARFPVPMEIPAGLTAPAGTVVNVVCTAFATCTVPPVMVLLGYLDDA